jgi:ABC-type sugar transport system substrate-binding protein
MKTQNNYTIIIVLLATVLVITAGCGGTDSQTIKIGFLVNNPEQTWFQNEWKYARQCGDDYGFEVVTIAATDGDKVLAAPRRVRRDLSSARQM